VPPALHQTSWLERFLQRLNRLAMRTTTVFSDPLRRFQLSIAFLFAFLFVGIIGYMIIERMSALDALYMTVITVTTVGYGDVMPTSQVSRVFTIILIFLGIGAATTAVSNALDAFVGQRLWSAVRERRIEEKLRMMEGHYIVAGYGRIGQQIVRDILTRNESCVVIDASIEVQTDEFLMDANVPFIIGDATEDALLEKAGVQRAKGFVAALPSDADNVLAILTVRGLSESIFIVARASDISSENKLKRAGANHVISPYNVGGHRMAMALLRPAVHDFMNHLSDMSDAESYDIGQIDIHAGSRLVGQTVMSSDLRSVRGLSILAIVQDGQLHINPSPNWEFKPGEHLVVIGPPQAIYAVEEIHGTDTPSG
jgi:voltage-gated potassium channel